MFCQQSYASLINFFYFSSGELGRTDLSKVVLQPLEGVVVLFVPDL